MASPSLSVDSQIAAVQAQIEALSGKKKKTTSSKAEQSLPMTSLDSVADIAQEVAPKEETQIPIKKDVSGKEGSDKEVPENEVSDSGKTVIQEHEEGMLGDEAVSKDLEDQPVHGPLETTEEMKELEKELETPKEKASRARKRPRKTIGDDDEEEEEENVQEVVAPQGSTEVLKTPTSKISKKIPSSSGTRKNLRSQVKKTAEEKGKQLAIVEEEEDPEESDMEDPNKKPIVSPLIITKELAARFQLKKRWEMICFQGWDHLSEDKVKVCSESVREFYSNFTCSTTGGLVVSCAKIGKKSVLFSSDDVAEWLKIPSESDGSLPAPGIWVGDKDQIMRNLFGREDVKMLVEQKYVK